MDISTLSSNQQIAQTRAGSPSHHATPLNPNNTSEREETALPAVEEAEKTNQQGLSEEEQRKVDELKKRDREVRAHEQAHMAAGGQYTSGASYEFARGPDGKSYAVGGEVSIDASAVPNDPEATLRKAEVIQRAAMAPADPSSQDRRVASQATAMATEARAQIREERQAESGTFGSSDSSSENTALTQRLAASGAVAQENDISNIDLFA